MNKNVVDVSESKELLISYPHAKTNLKYVMKKNVLITGATGNLGQAVVKRFAEDGYTIIATSHHSRELGYQTAGEVDVHQLNLNIRKEVINFIEEIYEKYDTIHAGLFLAGGYQYGNIHDVNETIIDKMIAINFKTAFLLSRQLFLKMLKQGKPGKLVFVGARPALQSSAGKDSFAYALSKSLIFQFSDLLNAEGVSTGITSSVVVPSIIDTPPNRKAMPDANFDHWVKPVEIADAIAYICSEKSSALRETVLKIYGRS